MPTPDQEINPDQPTPLRGALAVASLGLPVVPLHHPTKTTAGIEHARCSCGKYPCGPGNRNVGKHPCIGEGWQTKASTDPDQIRRWATEYPGCNFGYVLGDEFIGFDGDGRNGLDRGERELADQGHRFSDTLTVQTGDGWHRVYATDGIKFSSLRLATGIDGRTGNMILVAPDSLHWSGVRYILTSDAPIAPVDFWLWERLGIKGDDQEYPDGTEDGPPRHEKPPVGAEELVAKYEQVRPAIRSLFETEPPEGKWSDALWRLALELADAGADRDERMAVLKAAACNKSGRDGKGDRWLWRHYVVKAEEKQSQTDEKVLQQELKRLRVRDRARELLRAEKEADRYREPPPSRSLEHELADRPEPSRWAIPDWAPDEGNIGIEAKKKTGKTTLMGNVTKCLVDHLPFLGNEQWIPRELDGNVGYCNLELPDWQFLDWLEDMEIKNASRVIPWHLRGRRMPMNVDLVVERYIDWLTDHDIEVWILDPRNRAWKGIVTDENNNSQVNEWSAQVDYIKEEAGVRECYIPAHMGHEHERGRGASAWGDWLDAIWKLTDESGVRFLSAPEGRDVDQPKTKLLYNSSTRRLTAGAGSPEGLKKKDRLRSVIRALRDGPLQTRDLRSTMRDCQKDDRPLAIREAIGDGYVDTYEQGRSTMHHLTDKGRERLGFLGL